MLKSDISPSGDPAMIFIRSAFFIIIMVIATVPAAEKAIVIKGGGLFKGEFASETEDFIMLNSRGTNLRILKSMIVSIDGQPYGTTAPAATAGISAGPQRVALTLKNSAVYQGIVVEANADSLSLNADGIRMRIPQASIASVRVLEAAPVPVPASATPVTPAPAAKPATPVASAPPPASAFAPAPATQAPAPAPTAAIEPGSDHAMLLKNGSRFKGAVVAENENFITVKISTSKVNILKSMIVELDGRPYGAGETAAPEAAARLPAMSTAPVPVAPPAPPSPSAPKSLLPAQPVAVAPAPSAPSTAPNQPPTPPVPAALIPPAANPVAPLKSDTLTNVNVPITAQKTVPDTVKPPRTVTPATLPAAVNAAVSPIVAAPSKPDSTKKVGTGSLPQGAKPSTGQAPAADTVKHAAAPATPAPATPTRGVPAPSPAVAPAAAVAAAGGGAAPQAVKPKPSAFDTISAALQQSEVSETCRRMIRLLNAAERGPQSAGAIPQIIELLGDETAFKPNQAEKKLKVDSLAGKTPARAARFALIKIGSASVEPLIEALTIRNKAIRANSAWTLGQLKDARSVEPLINAVRDSSAMVRANASEALGKIRDPRSIPVLVTLLGEDTSEAVRVATQEALNNLTDIPTLITALHDPSDVVRTNVAYILFLMTAQDFRNDPLKWETWWKDQQSKPEKGAPVKEEPKTEKKDKEKKK
jgi:hypothetical protein